MTDRELWRLRGITMDVGCILRELRLQRPGYWDDWVRLEHFERALSWPAVGRLAGATYRDVVTRRPTRRA